MLKSQDWQVKVCQDWSDSRLKWLNCVSYLILSIGILYYQEGCNIDYLTRSKLLIGHPSEDPERKYLRTNLEILEWSSLNLMDQVRSLNKGLEYSDPDRSDRSGGATASFSLTGLEDRSDWSSLTVSTASFWVVGIYTPWPSLVGVTGSLHIPELLKAFSWPAISPQHSLWVVLTRLHILGLGWEIECVWAKWPLWELHFEQLGATIAWALLIPSKIQICICYSWRWAS